MIYIIAISSVELRSRSSYINRLYCSPPRLCSSVVNPRNLRFSRRVSVAMKNHGVCNHTCCVWNTVGAIGPLEANQSTNIMSSRYFFFLPEAGKDPAGVVLSWFSWQVKGIRMFTIANQGTFADKQISIVGFHHLSEPYTFALQTPQHNIQVIRVQLPETDSTKWCDTTL